VQNCLHDGGLCRDAGEAGPRQRQVVRGRERRKCLAVAGEGRNLDITGIEPRQARLVGGRDIPPDGAQDGQWLRHNAQLACHVASRQRCVAGDDDDVVGGLEQRFHRPPRVLLDGRLHHDKPAKDEARLRVCPGQPLSVGIRCHTVKHTVTHGEHARPLCRQPLGRRAVVGRRIRHHRQHNFGGPLERDKDAAGAVSRLVCRHHAHALEVAAEREAPKRAQYLLGAPARRCNIRPAVRPLQALQHLHLSSERDEEARTMSQAAVLAGPLDRKGGNRSSTLPSSCCGSQTSLYPPNIPFTSHYPLAPPNNS